MNSRSVNSDNIVDPVGPGLAAADANEILRLLDNNDHNNNVTPSPSPSPGPPSLSPPPPPPASPTATPTATATTTATPRRRDMVWVTVGKTQHVAYVVIADNNNNKDSCSNSCSRDDDGKVLIEWEANQQPQWVARSTVQWSLPPRRRKRAAVTAAATSPRRSVAAKSGNHRTTPTTTTTTTSTTAVLLGTPPERRRRSATAAAFVVTPLAVVAKKTNNHPEETQSDRNDTVVEQQSHDDDDDDIDTRMEEARMEEDDDNEVQTNQGASEKDSINGQEEEEEAVATAVEALPNDGEDTTIYPMEDGTLEVNPAPKLAAAAAAAASSRTEEDNKEDDEMERIHFKNSDHDDEMQEAAPDNHNDARIHKGMRIKKLFFAGTKYAQYHKGQVISEQPQWSTLDDEGNEGNTWEIKYRDGDKEGMTAAEILQYLDRDEDTDGDEIPQSSPNRRRKAKRYQRRSTKRTKHSPAVELSEKQEDKESTEGAAEEGREEQHGEEDSKPAASKRGRPRKAKEKQKSYLGWTFTKLFEEDGRNYSGVVIRGPEKVFNKQRKAYERSWRVSYEEDEQEEDLTEEQLEDYQATATTEVPVLETPASTEHTTRESAKQTLCAFPGVTEWEAEKALEEMEGPPYLLNKAIHLIYRRRNELAEQRVAAESAAFKPVVGTRIRKSFGGVQYHGTITKIPPKPRTKEEKQFYKVKYDDGDSEDMDWLDVVSFRADRPVQPSPIRGRRPLGALELFSGCGIVSQEFAQRQWKILSVDNSEDSNATHKVSIMDLQRPGQTATDGSRIPVLPEHGSFGLGTGFGVPDFIWASPPCFTYSLLAGGKHRDVRSEQYEKTADAHESNVLFVRMAEIMTWARDRHPHCIIVIENPKGLLDKMPLMTGLKKELRLHRAEVHYCAFGRKDKKPTHLWTNDPILSARLSSFTCENSDCPYTNTTHPVSVRSHGHTFNAAAIPQPLAEEVARYVDSLFYQQSISDRPQAKP